MNLLLFGLLPTYCQKIWWAIDWFECFGGFFSSESRSNLSQLQKFEKQTDAGLTQCPPQRKQDTIHQESITHQEKKSAMKEGSKHRRTKYQVSKERQVKRNVKAIGKQQMSPKMVKTPVHYSAPTTKDPRERVPLTVKTDNVSNFPSKEKKV